MSQVGTFPVLKYFEYAHLPVNLQRISIPFHRLANTIADEWAGGDMDNVAEIAAGLRKLLEAKDCVVRAWIT